MFLPFGPALPELSYSCSGEQVGEQPEPGLRKAATLTNYVGISIRLVFVENTQKQCRSFAPKGTCQSDHVMLRN